MRKLDEKYNNGQPVSERKGDVLTYFFIDGRIKAQGKFVDGKMVGKWIFNKKEGFLWQVGHFKDGVQHGKWVRYNSDGSVFKEMTFENGKQVKS